jgi:hypothetical protein
MSDELRQYLQAVAALALEVSARPELLSELQQSERRIAA